MSANLENSAVATGLENISFNSNPQKRQCSKFSKWGFNSTWIKNFHMFKLDEPEIKLPASVGSLKKQESSSKTSVSALLAVLKLLCGSQHTGKLFKRWEYQATCMRNLYAGQEATVRTGHGTSDCFQIGKGVSQGCILSRCLFNLHAEYIMSNEILSWMKHKLESRLQTDI